MKIITISGLDGSGKSTQIELLKSYLENQGKKVFYFHAVQFSLANKFVKNRGETSTGSVTKANLVQIFLRKIFLQIDILRFKKLYKQLESDGHDFILSDRYFYDTIINIVYLSNLKPGFRKFLKPGFRKPDLAIYLNADPEKIMQHERKPDQGMEYLQKKKELYDQAASGWNLQIVDGNRGQAEIFAEIKEKSR